MSSQRQNDLRKQNNQAWKPDNLGDLAGMAVANPATRQLRLDPRQTEVNHYQGPASPTGDPKESAKKRHDVGEIHVYLDTVEGSPLLVDDPPTNANRPLKADKARERGWSEIFLDSYKDLLQNCEKYLNGQFVGKRWRSIFDHAPAEWAASTHPIMPPLTQADCKAAMTGKFFPVHAMGYNWLEGNEKSAIRLKDRITSLIDHYRCAGFQCDKVILITHSMGGLVARALVHPDIGNLGEKILGIVHGVMPSLGAPAAYRRMRCGFEQGDPKSFMASFPLGNTGAKVTAVLGNSPGALQLLPSKGYGNGWLEVRVDKACIGRFPQRGDPYEEIYKVSDQWYGLLREEWLNPANAKNAGVEHTRKLLDSAKTFHEKIASTFHPLTYAHYGADSSRPSWEQITWNLNHGFTGTDWRSLIIDGDNEQGELSLRATDPNGLGLLQGVAKLGASSGGGDQTVPTRSSDHHLRAKITGVFRQTGYEHQSSYSNENVLNATLYSIVRIAQKME